MRADDRDLVFGARTHHIPVVAGEADVGEGSRLGGRAPAALSEAAVRCPRCGGGMAYDFTLASTDLGAARDVSHFHCRDFACLLAGGAALTSLASPPSTLTVAHAASPRAATQTPLDSPNGGRALVLGRRQVDGVPGGEPDEHTKLGGAPGLIQAGEGLESVLEAQGLGFLFQLSELDQPKDLTPRSYEYAGGTLYLFAAFDPDGAPATTRFSSFWQRT